jgi:hypothetical protein
MAGLALSSAPTRNIWLEREKKTNDGAGDGRKKEGEHEHNQRVEHKHGQKCGGDVSHESLRSESETMRG